MSGQDLIDEMRSDPKRAPKAANGLRAMDMLLVIVAVAAVGSLGYFALTRWVGGPPQGPAPVQASVSSPAPRVEVAWTETDNNKCRARAGAEAEHPAVPDMAMMANRVVAEGIAGLATMVECKLVTKTTRFCDPEQRKALVATVNDYLTRVDIVIAGLGIQGAPMKIMGGLFGGEMKAGNDIYQLERESTVAVMKGYDDRVVTAFRKLARDGLVAPTDFAGFMGGVPENITRMFGDVTAARDVCA
jgi:hypothetical protein